jgi:hypothetical protein
MLLTTHELPPTLTVAPLLKSVPLTVIVSPPEVEPEIGTTEVIVGADFCTTPRQEVSGGKDSKLLPAPYVIVLIAKILPSIRVPAPTVIDPSTKILPGIDECAPAV